MKKIASFTIDHTVLTAGIYVSRVDGDCITYDLRLKRPNREPVVSNGAIHTLEHLVATYVRNSKFSDSVIYFGPMGCRTGFYFIVRDSVKKSDVIGLVKEAFRFSADFDGEIPGATEIECGNYREHDLGGAKQEAKNYLEAIKDWTENKLVYPEK